MTIESVIKVRRNGPLIASAAELWIRPQDRVMDITYGRGNFWTDFRPAHLITHDLANDEVDFRQLPEADGSIDVIVFDPPYIAQGGRTTSTIPDFLDRYGLVDCPKDREGSLEMIGAGIKEASRVLAPGGRLLVKCMDYINGGRFVTGRNYVVNAAVGCGLEQIDEFVHHKGSGPQPKVNLDGSARVQMHSRRVHSFLCVFQAPPIWRNNRARIEH